LIQFKRTQEFFPIIHMRVREINIKLAGKIAVGSFSTDARQKRGKSRVRRSHGGTVADRRKKGEERTGRTRCSRMALSQRRSQQCLP